MCTMADNEGHPFVINDLLEIFVDAVDERDDLMYKRCHRLRYFQRYLLEKLNNKIKSE